MVMVETALFRSLLHINTVKKVAAMHLMQWQQPLLPDISVFLSCLHVLEVHPNLWILLEGHLDCLNICLTNILCIFRLDQYSLYPRSINSSDYIPSSFLYVILHSEHLLLIYSSLNVSMSQNRAQGPLYQFGLLPSHLSLQ